MIHGCLPYDYIIHVSRFARAGADQRADRGGACGRRECRDGVCPRPGRVAERGAGDDGRCDQFSVDCHSVVYPRRCDYEFNRYLASPDRLCLGHLRLRQGWPGHGEYRHLAILRRDFRLRGGRRRRARIDTDSIDEEQGLPRSVRGGGDLVVGNARGDHSAVDPDDSVRGDGAKLGGAIVRRRHRPGCARRIPDDGGRTPLRGALQLPGRGSVQGQSGSGDLQGRGARLHSAPDYSRRHLRRFRHRHRGRGTRGGGGNGDRFYLSRTRLATFETGDDRRQRTNLGGDAAGGVVGADRRIPHRSPGAADARRRHRQHHAEQVLRARAAKPVLSGGRFVSALGRGDHPGGADCHAAGAPGWYRPGAFRHYRDAESRHRPANPACGERAGHRLLGGEGRYLGGQQDQHLLHRRPVCRSHDGDLPSVHGAQPGRSVLWRLKRWPIPS